MIYYKWSVELQMYFMIYFVQVTSQVTCNFFLHFRDHLKTAAERKWKEHVYLLCNSCLDNDDLLYILGILTFMQLNDI